MASPRLEAQTADVRNRCAREGERRGWTAEVVWTKAISSTEILQLKDPLDGLDFLESSIVIHKEGTI